MNTSILVARLFAPAFICIGLGLFLSQAYYKKAMQELIKNPVSAFLGGIMALIGGILIVSYHNVWEASWTVIITIFGWLSLIKGVLLLLIPEPFMDLALPMVKDKYLPVVGAIALILGLVMGYFGFMA